MSMSLATGTFVRYRQFPVGDLMDIHEGASWLSMSKKLEISQRNESQLQGRADGLTSIGGIELAE